ncbi:MAG: alpha/beta fold hydrolase [Myxococcales bacterium]
MGNGEDSFAARWKKRADLLGRGAQNALEVARLGRLTPAQRTPYSVEHEGRIFELRRYAAQPNLQWVEHPILLVPALMVRSDVYDLEPTSSVVAFLARAGVDTWLVDFGDPSNVQGGLERTQDDHVRAVSECIETIRERTGKEVHVAGYSQGGMLAYQVCALRRSEGIKSLITFGALVDLHASSLLDPDLFGKALELLRSGLLRTLGSIESLPGGLSSALFKVLNWDRRALEFLQFLGDLHDRRAIEEGEGKRHFLAGEGFVAWPGPAVARFADELLLGNRLMQGGFVIDGRVCSLDDITSPLLYFTGERDTIASPRSVSAIEMAAPHIRELYKISVPSGHIGLVVSRKAFEVTWPSVVEWLRWRESSGPKPVHLVGHDKRGGMGGALNELSDGIELLHGASTGVLTTLRERMQQVTRSSLSWSENVRFQVARLAKLERLTPHTRVSFGLALKEQAERNPHGAWFIYDGRGQSYAQANERVDHVVKGLIACGIRPRQQVGVLMLNRPSYLSIVTALSRLGAVSVLLSPNAETHQLENMISMVPLDALVADPDNVLRARQAFRGKVLMLGAPKGPRPKLQDFLDMETLETDRVTLPNWYHENPGRAEDLAMIMFTTGRFDEPRAARITNRRWAVAAYGAAAAASLSPKDTVYACTPLHHASGMLVATGGALVGRARLALTQSFAAERFWPEVRRYGVTVVFYAGEMLRELVDAPSYRGEQQNPLRLFAGSGMRADIWRRLIARFGSVGVLEFYASTEGTGVLANVAGEKIGSLGRPLPGVNDMLLVAFDFERKRAIRDKEGLCMEAAIDEPGLLLTRIDTEKAKTTFDGYVDSEETEGRIRHDVRARGDTWFVTGDVMYRDGQGDYWFLDRLGDVVRTSFGPVFTRPVEDALYDLSEVRLAVVYGSNAQEGEQTIEAALQLREGRSLSAEALYRLCEQRLEPNARPAVVHVVSAVPTTEGHRPLKGALRQGLNDDQILVSYRYDEGEQRYVLT